MEGMIKLLIIRTKLDNFFFIGHSQCEQVVQACPPHYWRSFAVRPFLTFVDRMIASSTENRRAASVITNV